MASYPTSVKTFASRSNGQTIDAAHVGDLQDEVNAIESGILNGTAPVTCSRVTAASLSVAGNSTVSGLTVSSNLTVSGGATVSSNLSIGNLNVGDVYAAGSLIATSWGITGATAFNGQGGYVLPNGNTDNMSLGTYNFLYVTPNSSGSTLTGMVRTADYAQFVLMFVAGTNLAIRNSTGSVSTNQFQLANGDTSITAGQCVPFIYNTVSGRWNKVG